MIGEIARRDFTGAHLYFPMHGEFTRQEKETVELMCKTARSCVKYVVPCAPENFGKTEFYVSADVTAQLKAAAKRIRYNAKNGVPYEKMGVIAPQSALGQTERIFKEFDIPFYIDKKVELGAQALPQFLETLFAVVGNGYNADDCISLTKNYYFGAEKSESDAFENYCLKYRVDYLGFFEPFARGSEEERALPEKVRVRLACLVRDFEKSLKSVCDADGFYSLVCAVCEQDGVAEKTARLGEAAGVDLSAVPEKMRATAALLKEVWGDKKVKPDELSETFFEGLSAVFIASLPKERGTVEVGDGQSFIASRLTHTFVIGLEEGVMPPVLADCAVITDKDIDVLESAGVTLEPKISDMNRSSDDGFLHSAASGEFLFVGVKEEPKKSSFPALGAIYSGAKEKAENSPQAEEERLKNTAMKNYAAYAARHCSTLGNAAETYLISRARAAEGGKGLPFERELKDALEESGVKIAESYAFDDFGIKDRHDVFFYKNSTTISRVQDYFACPYRNFLKNAVRLSEREDGKLRPMDVGTFLHRVIELFVASGKFYDPSEEEKEIEKAISATLGENEKYVLDANKPFIERISDEARAVARVTAAQIRGGSFASLGQEMRFGFGENSDLKTVGIEADGRKIALRGIIDRVDVYKNFARVIDYKTGGAIKRNFDFSDLYYGKKIQLMLYMKILEENGYLPAGMFYFPFSVSWDDNEYSHKLIGVYNGDDEISVALDNALKDCGAKSKIISARRKKDGEFENSNYAFSTEGLKKLSSYALEVLQKAAEEILSGETGRSPFLGECRYCAYNSVCRADENTVSERLPYKANAQTVLDAVDNARGEK